MLIEFKVSNYRSFRDEAVLSMEAADLGSCKNVSIEYRLSGKPMHLLPAVAIYGKNGGGKSNIIRAFWLATQFIKNAQRTQHENAAIPVRPFMLDDDSRTKPTAFEFTYIHEGIKYVYGFAATKEQVTREYLYYFPKGQKALVFDREYQNFTFRANTEKRKRKLISEAVAQNQLYFSVACTMNEKTCVDAMKWFRDNIFFSRDYTDIPEQLLNYSEDDNMLQAISTYARAIDVGIQDMRFKIKNTELSNKTALADDLPDAVKASLMRFTQALSDAPNASETKLQMGEVHAAAYHQGVNRDGQTAYYELNLVDESDGTRQLMALAPAIERALNRGGILCVDVLEKELHPLFVEFIIDKFQNPEINTNHAQLVFITHNTELLNMKILRKDQLYFVDKDRRDGASSIYSILGTATSENVRKSYLSGKYGATPDLAIEVK